MKRCCVVVCSRTSKLSPAKQRLQEYLKGTNGREMACNLFHYFPIQFIVAVTVTVAVAVWQAALVVVVALGEENVRVKVDLKKKKRKEKRLQHSEFPGCLQP